MEIHDRHAVLAESSIEPDEPRSTLGSPDVSDEREKGGHWKRRSSNEEELNEKRS